MPGINTGVLSNAYPLTAEQISELERRVLENQEAFAFLNENSELCFAIPQGVDGIKDLAWNSVYELANQDNILIKKEYKKVSLKSYYLANTFTKEHLLDIWQSNNSIFVKLLSSDNFILTDSSGLLLTVKT